MDFDSIAWLEKRLSTYKGALLVVTHDRYFLDRVANAIWELDHGTLYQYAGNYEAYVEKKAEQVEADTIAAHKEQQLYKQELAWMHAGAQARSTKQQARINRFNDIKQNMNDRPEAQGQVEMKVASTRLGKKK